MVESEDEECYLETENHEEDNEVADKDVEFAVLQCQIDDLEYEIGKLRKKVLSLWFVVAILVAFLL